MIWLQSSSPKVKGKKNGFEFILEFCFELSNNRNVVFKRSQHTTPARMGQKDAGDQERWGSVPTMHWAHTLQSEVWLTCKDAFTSFVSYKSCLHHTNRHKVCNFSLDPVSSWGRSYCIFICDPGASQVKNGPPLKQLHFPLFFIPRINPLSRQRKEVRYKPSMRSVSSAAVMLFGLAVLGKPLSLQSCSRFIFLWKCLCSCKV